MLCRIREMIAMVSTATRTSLRKRKPVERLTMDAEDDGPKREKKRTRTMTTTQAAKTKAVTVKVEPRAMKPSDDVPSTTAKKPKTTKAKAELAKAQPSGKSSATSSNKKGPNTIAKTTKGKTTKKMEKSGVALPDDVWGAIAQFVCEDVDEDKLYSTHRKTGEKVDKRKVVYKRRLDTLFAMRGTNKQLCRVMSSDFGEEIFQLAFENFCEVSDATHGIDNAPPTMLWRHKAFFLTGLGCQSCDAHPTTRKPNWVFGVRMCKDCLQKHTVIHQELEDESWTKSATYEELTKGLPHDEVQGWSQFYRSPYTMIRFWKQSVTNRKALLSRAKTPSERERICAPPAPKQDKQLLEKKAREKRTEALKAELDLIGCELRADSKLSELFIEGFPKSLRLRKKWTAKNVAKRMAQMKYLHEYCREFQETIQDWREEINDMFDVYGHGYGNYTYEVTGFHRFGAAVRDLADTWTRFPKQWPWLVQPTT